jgi:hypothetical protein
LLEVAICDRFRSADDGLAIGVAKKGQWGFADAMTAANPTKACNQDDAIGFIRLNALRLKDAAKVHKKK